MTGPAVLYVPFLVFAALVALALAAYGWRRRRLLPGEAAFSVFNVGVAVWTGISALGLVAKGAAALFWANLAYFGIVLVPASFFVFALRYAGHGHRVTRRVLGLLAVEPVATIALAWTNPWHHWFRARDFVDPTWEPALGFWLHAAYSYVLVLAGTALIARRAWTEAGAERGQAATLLLAALAPSTANAVYLGGLSPFGNLDLSPFGFAVTSVAMALVLFRDLERRLQAAERRFRAVLDHARDAVEVIDAASGRILDVNETACVARGYARGAYLALSAPDLDAPGTRRPWSLVRDEAQRQGSHVFEGEERRRDGTVVPVEVAATWVSLDRAYVLRVVRDITARKKAEEEQARLGRVVVKLERQLAQAQKMEAIGRLAGGVAHDFNNLLGVILGYGEITRRGLGEGDPLAAKVDKILKAGERAAGLTRQLLAFSRTQVLEARVVDLGDLVGSLEAMLTRAIGQDVELLTTRAPGPCRVKVDPGQIEQVVMNLVVNAKDAMPQGGRVKIETRRVELHGDHAERHPEARPGPYAVLAVADTGTGMDAATQGRMFEPFFTTKPRGRGTGLGLAMAYGTVRQSGGHITCRSEVGVGTTFEVYLPLVDEQVSPAADAPPARPPAAGRETVLLIEDEASLRDLLVETLEGAGYAVLVAPGGEDALRMVQEHPGVIHLVVTDVMMPGLTGRQVAERIRAARPEVRILFVSGYVGDALARHGVSEPEARLLSKPFTAEALLRKVREVLDGP